MQSAGCSPQYPAKRHDNKRRGLIAKTTALIAIIKAQPFPYLQRGILGTALCVHLQQILRHNLLLIHNVCNNWDQSAPHQRRSRAKGFATLSMYPLDPEQISLLPDAYLGASARQCRWVLPRLRLPRAPGRLWKHFGSPRTRRLPDDPEAPESGAATKEARSCDSELEALRKACLFAIPAKNVFFSRHAPQVVETRVPAGCGHSRAREGSA